MAFLPFFEEQLDLPFDLFQTDQLWYIDIPLDCQQADILDGQQADISDGRQVDISDGRQADISDGQQANISDGRQANISDGRHIGLKNHKKMKKVHEYCDFYSVNYRQTSRRCTDDTKYWLRKWRSDMIRASKGLGLSSPLDEEQIEMVLKVDPDFFKEQDFISIKIQNINDYCSFYRINQRHPKIHSVNVMESKLGNWRSNMKRAAKGLSTNVPLDNEQRAYILSVDPAFYGK